MLQQINRLANLETSDVRQALDKTLEELKEI